MFNTFAKKVRKTARIAKILIFSENMKLITKSVSAVILAVACLQPAAWAQSGEQPSKKTASRQ